jgi:hypothetical protein
LSNCGHIVAVDNEIVIVEVTGEDRPICGVVVDAVCFVHADVVDDVALEVGQGYCVVLVDVYDQVLVYNGEELLFYCVVVAGGGGGDA